MFGTPSRCYVMVFEYLRKKTLLEELVKNSYTIFLTSSPYGCTGVPKQKIVQTKNPFPDVAFTSSIRGTDHVGCLNLKLFRNIGLGLSIGGNLGVSRADYIMEKRPTAGRVQVVSN